MYTVYLCSCSPVLIHAQTQVELDRTVVHVSSGSDQHAAITTSITNSITTLSQSVTWACVGLDVGFPDARAIVKTGGFVSQDVRGIKKTQGNARKRIFRFFLVEFI